MIITDTHPTKEDEEEIQKFINSNDLLKAKKKISDLELVYKNSLTVIYYDSFIKNLEGDFDEDSLRRIRYDFSVDVLRKETVSTTYVPSTLLRDSGTVDREMCWQPGVLEWAGTTRRLPYDRAALLPRRARAVVRFQLWILHTEQREQLGSHLRGARPGGREDRGVRGSPVRHEERLVLLRRRRARDAQQGGVPVSRVVRGRR